VSPAVSTFEKNDFIPTFFYGRDTALVSYDPASSSGYPGIQFLFKPQDFDIELSASGGDDMGH